LDAIAILSNAWKKGILPMAQLTPAIIMLAVVILIFRYKLGAGKWEIVSCVALAVALVALYTAVVGITPEVKVALVVCAGIAATISVNPILLWLSNWWRTA
jgi:hypothetical protein